MGENAARRGPTPALAAVLALCLCVMVWFGFQKQGYHPDEEITYQLSNSYYEPWLTWYTPSYTARELVQDHLLGTSVGDTLGKWHTLATDMSQNGVKGSAFYQSYRLLADQADLATEPAWRTADYFIDTFSVRADQRFSAASVYYNQCADTHPPLYYLLVNFVSSLFPGQFSKWFALSINYAAMLGVLTLLYGIVRRWFGKERMALLVTLAYGVSMAAMTTVQFLRMYTLLTLFTTAFFALCLALLDADWTAAPFRWKLAFFFSILLGFYTQYYFSIFAVAATLVVLPRLAMQKRWRCVGGYVVCAGLAFGCSLLIWPFSLKHIFMGARGAGAFESIRSGAYVQKLTNFLLTGEQTLFEHCWVLLAVFAVCCGFAALLLVRRPKGAQKSAALTKYLLTAGICGGHLLVVALVSPMYAIRYIVCIFPLVFILLAKGTEKTLQWLTERFPKLPRHSAAVCLCGLFAAAQVWNFATAQPDSYPEQETRMKTAQANAGATCVYYCPDVYDWTWASAALDMRWYEKSAMVQQSRLDWLGDNLAIEPGDVMMVYVSNVMEQSEALTDLYEQFGREPQSIEKLADRADFYAYVYRMTF